MQTVKEKSTPIQVSKQHSLVPNDVSGPMPNLAEDVVLGLITQERLKNSKESDYVDIELLLQTDTQPPEKI